MSHSPPERGPDAAPPPRPWVVVTGASGAIGSSTAGAFLARGLDVLGLDRRPAPGWASGASSGAGRYRHAVADVTDEPAVRAALAGAAAEAGAPPVHVASIAGGAVPGEVAGGVARGLVDLEVFRASLDANLVSHYGVVRAAAELMTAPGGPPPTVGSITLCASFAAFVGLGLPGYGAAKAGLVGLVKALAEPLGRAGVRINAVAPGTVRTPRNEAQWPAERFERLVRQAPLGRLAEPDDVAAAFVALACDLRHVTGEVLVVDGGQSVVIEPR